MKKKNVIIPTAMAICAFTVLTFSAIKRDNLVKANHTCCPEDMSVCTDENLEIIWDYYGISHGPCPDQKPVLE